MEGVDENVEEAQGMPGSDTAGIRQVDISDQDMALHFASLHGKGKRRAARSPSPVYTPQPYDTPQKKRIVTTTGMLSSKHANISMPVPGEKALPQLALPPTAGHGGIHASQWASSTNSAATAPRPSPPKRRTVPPPRPAAPGRTTQPSHTSPRQSPTPAPQSSVATPDFSQHNPKLMEQLWNQNRTLHAQMGILIQMLASAGIPIPSATAPTGPPTPPAAAPARPTTYRTALQTDLPTRPAPKPVGTGPPNTATATMPASQGYPAPTERRPSQPPSTQRRILASSSSPAHGNPLAIREAVNCAVFAVTKLSGPAVRSAHVNGKGNLVLTLMEHVSTDLLMANAQHIEKKLSPFFGNQACTLTVPTRWRKVHLASVNCLDFAGEHGMQALRQEIEAYNPQLKLACVPRWLLRDIPSHKVCSSVVLSFEDETCYKKALKGVWVNGVRLRTSTFYAARPQDQCRRCQMFGHAWQTCRYQEACKYCAGKHASSKHTCSQCNVEGKHCSHTQAKCIHCAEDHFATSPDCSYRQKVIARVFQHRQAAHTNRTDD